MLILFQVLGGFSDGNIHYLSGAGVPGGDVSFQDSAPKGSFYSSTTLGVPFIKSLSGTGTDKWSTLNSSDELWTPNQSYVDNIDKYLGYNSNLNNWQIKHYDGTMSNATRVYANVSNNPSYLTLSTAWADRSILVYT